MPIYNPRDFELSLVDFFTDFFPKKGENSPFLHFSSSSFVYILVILHNYVNKLEDVCLFKYIFRQIFPYFPHFAALNS